MHIPTFNYQIQWENLNKSLWQSVIEVTILNRSTYTCPYIIGIIPYTVRDDPATEHPKAKHLSWKDVILIVILITITSYNILKWKFR